MKAMILILSLITFNAHAADVWTLLKKQQGPQGLECSPTVELSISGDVVSLIQGESESLYYAVNKGVQCQDGNSSEIVRRKKCFTSDLTDNGKTWTLTYRSCQGNIFGSKCDPRAEEVSKSAVIDRRTATLTVSEATNSSDDPVFACVYSK